LPATGLQHRCWSKIDFSFGFCNTNIEVQILLILQNVEKERKMDEFKMVVILLVEDDVADQKLIKQSLSSGKVVNEIHVVNNGEQALEYLKRSKNSDPDSPMPDLILLDLNMPGMGGKEFLKCIKSDDELDAIPVVVLTTSDSDKDILETFKLQVSGYVKKPVRLEDFQRAMQNLSEYWFVICKRVCHEGKNERQIHKCFVSR
jgi:CheY-like chemotaxis protein